MKKCIHCRMSVFQKIIFKGAPHLKKGTCWKIATQKSEKLYFYMLKVFLISFYGKIVMNFRNYTGHGKV